MKIRKTVLKELNMLVPDTPPEIGGILGSKDNDCITDMTMDKIETSTIKACRYEPNVSYLNKCISEWATNGIYFKGVFHTHFMGVRTLSDADRIYINKIMQNMPDSIKYLYFPIFVLPERVFVCYKAERRNYEISITCEDVICT